MGKLAHPNIIRLHESFSDEQHLYIIMQYASKGDLHQFLKRRRIRREVFTQQQVWEMARQLLSALEYLHARSIIHRDVKTLNIFVDNQSRLYLGDLGVSKILKTDCGLYSRVGTPLYLAPQIIRSQKYDHKADIWGLGCVCYQLAALQHPFQGKNIIHLGQNIVGAQPKQLLNYSADLNAFVMDMLEKSPFKRPSASDLLKKYFKEKPMSLPSEEKEVSRLSILSNLKIEGSNKISGGRQILEMRGSRMKQETFKDFFEAKPPLRQDPIKEQSPKTVKDSDDFDQTIILVKKGELQDAKKYVQATRKTYLISRSDNIQSQKSCEPQKSISKLDEKQGKSNILSFISEKKLAPSTDLSIKPVKSNQLPSFERDKNAVSTGVIAEVSRLPSETSIGNLKARIRPKSSIMTKERHESTMKNIRKNFKKVAIEDLDSFVETRFLKRPEVIIL